jgi:hypothetical protein
LRGGDEGEGGAASEIFRVYNQAFLQLSVTLSQPSPLKGGGNKFNFFPFKWEGLIIILSPSSGRDFNPHESLKSLNS